MPQSDSITSNLLYKQQDVEKAFSDGLSEVIRKDFPQIERRANLSVEDFRKDYVDQNKPVILTGIADAQKFNLDYFSNKTGETEVFIDLYDTKKTERSNIAALVDKIGSSTPDKPVYLQEWWFEKDFPEFFDDFKLADHFADDWGKKILGCTPYTLWIGSKGSITPIHEDTWHFNLYTTQLFGKKEWFLFSKEAFLHTGSDGKPDLERLLADPASQPLSCVLKAGEILFMPYKWWHRTETLEHSASFNAPYLTEEIIQPYTQAVLSLPMMLALKSDELKALNPMRYNVTRQRVEMFAHHIGFNPDYVIHAIKNTHDAEKDKEYKKAA